MTTLLAFALGAWLAGAGEDAAWRQWGGPHRNFVIEGGPALAAAWPETGPARIWDRPLGDGYSAVVGDGSTIYTLYRDGSEDVAIALDAKTGRTRWEARYDAPFQETCSQRVGPVPRAAPLLDGERVITVSAGGLMNAFDRATGRRMWSHDLFADGSGEVRPCGYSSSPLAYRQRIITTAGGPGRGVVALHAATGQLAWRSQDFASGYSSPILIDLDGRAQVVVFTYGEVAGLDPDTGALEWSWPHPADYGVNVATPVWGDDLLLFVSSAYNGGSRVLRLTRQGGTVSVEEVWAHKRFRVHFGNAVRLGTRIYASSGDFGAAPFAALDVATGEMVWRDRAVARSTLLAADGRLIILDEDGSLVLATPGDAGLEVHGRTQVADGRAWTVPTLVGTTLFVRTRTRIVALDLGA